MTQTEHGNKKHFSLSCEIVILLIIVFFAATVPVSVGIFIGK